MAYVSSWTGRGKQYILLRFDRKSVDLTFRISPLTPGKFRGKIRGKFSAEYSDNSTYFRKNLTILGCF